MSFLLRNVLLLLMLSCFPLKGIFAQQLYFYDEFSGGVTAGGYSPGTAKAGIGAIQINVPVGATIRKALLLAGNHHNVNPVTVELNKVPFTFSIPTTVITRGFYSSYGSPATVHAIDVTKAIDQSKPGQILKVPFQTLSLANYSDFYLVVLYETTNLPKVRVSIFVDTLDFQATMNYTLPISTHSKSTGDLSLGIIAGYMCDPTDAEDITCNGKLLGTIWGPENNSGTCSGPYANFYYENALLHGLGDDNEDQQMQRVDALSNIRSLVNPGDKKLQLSCTHIPSSQGQVNNSIWGVVIVDGDTGCISRAVSVYPDSIDFGQAPLCTSFDTIITLYNTGCAELQIDSAHLAGAGFTISNVTFPIIIPPGDSSKITISGVLDTIGGKITSTATVNIAAHADNTLAPLVVKRSYIYPKTYSISLQPSVIIAHTGDSIEFEIKTDADLSTAKTLDFDLTGNSDLLEFISSKGYNSLTYSNGHIHITGNPFITMMDGVINSIRFKVYLAKDSIAKLDISNLALDSNGTTIIPCIASIASISGADFHYRFECGETTIGYYLGTGTLPKLSIYPNPAVTALNIDFESPIESDLSISISNMLGEHVADQSYHILSGHFKTTLDIAPLHSGMYFITIHGANTLLVSEFMKVW
jgi:hypothetical protein